MKNAIGAAAFAAALAAPSQSDAIIMDMGWGNNMCVMSAADKTGAWDCRQELRPSNQKTPAGVLLSTRLRIKECDGVAAQSPLQTDPKNPKRELTYVTGDGAAACLSEALEEVNRELKAYAIRCSVAATAAPTPEQPSRQEVSAVCK